MSYLWLLIDIFSTKSFDIIHIMWNSLVMTNFHFHSCLYIHMLLIFFCSILNCAPWHLFCSCSNGLLTCSYVHFDDFTYLLVRYSLRSFFCFRLFVLVISRGFILKIVTEFALYVPCTLCPDLLCNTFQRFLWQDDVWYS